MNPKEKCDKAKKWQDKVIIIAFHHRLEMIRDNWNMRKTAKYFDFSVGYVSEAIKLADNLDKVKHFALRKDALKWLKEHGK